MALSALLVIVGLVAAWFIISIPLYLAAKVVSGRKATFGRALLASLIAPIVVYIFLFLFLILLSPFLLLLAIPVSLILAIIVLVYIYASIFQTSWLGGLGIAIISFVITLIIFAIFSAFFAILPFGTSIFHGGPPGGMLP